MPPKLSDYLGESDKDRLGISKRECDEKEIKKIVEITVAEFLEPLLRELRELKESINELKLLINNIDKDEIRFRSNRAPASKSKSIKNLKIKKIIEKEGYLLASQALQKAGISRFTLANVVGDEAFVTIDLGVDYVIFSKETYGEFLGLLSKVDSPDSEEAAKRMGRFKDLFYLLRRLSLVYYDSRSKAWKMLV